MEHDIAELFEAVKKLPRTKEGIFDWSGSPWAKRSPYWVAASVYPMYASYETNYHKKEDYPDLLQQIKIWERRLDGEFTFENATWFLQMMINVIDRMSQEIYEYYRELTAIFKETVKRAIETFYADGAFADENGARNEEAEVRLRGAIAQACSSYVLLAEKYERYC